MMTGVDIVHVPYRGGGPAMIDLISGRVQLMFDNLPTSVEFIKSQKIRALAVTTATRSEIVPDLPTVAGTPPDIVDKLNKTVNAILADPVTKSRFTELGASLLPGTPAEFGKLLSDETQKWGKVIRFAGIKAE